MGLTYLDHETWAQAAVAGTTSGRDGRGGLPDLFHLTGSGGMKGRRDRVVRQRAGMEIIYRGHDT